ncbi:DEAD/DEAH box helicase [Desulfoscipio gibsoniae]|uniref:DNA/RNA helicase, superfamily II, SNF2 family n=1 Tax=Desulfoscipio gibsoniae DSM 7213 TaxID=767817 RepID=R4KLQ8_9FIRM|nr:SNF2-related protein [Desulfoscipio gibsoniae]AGL02492.1 DNA/RNA helicase, superfamily II, SNF2 family [Desulfoscipio gibsoniae DSM 7213]
MLLRRQALQLSLSPGFDTLLSLSAVRNVQPLEYQQQTVRHVLRHLRGRALLCDEVGLGKTVEAGLIMMEYLLRGLIRWVLILTPPTLVEQWREEMYTKFNLDFITYDSAAFKSEPNPWSTFPHIIASLDTAKRENHRRQVLEAEYDLVIVDEAHHLKNSRTKAYQLVSHLKKKYILLLTATPVENDLGELFNLITLLLPGQLETAASFKRKYITRGNPLKVKNSVDLKRLVREVMVRNRRSETGAIACQRRAEVIEVTLSLAEKAFYQRLTTFVRGYYTPGADKPAAGVNRFVLKMLQREAGSSLEALVTTLDRMSANPEQPAPLRRVFSTLAAQAREIKERSKADTLVRLLEQINDQVVVFTSFRETQRSLSTLLRDRGFKIAELHGDMRRLEKEEHVQLFMSDARVLVATETGSEGRNLQFCRNLINYDLPWNPMRIEQRIGRIHRLGQTRNVYIYNLSAAGTIESYILELLDAKINMFQLVVGELDMILGNLKEKRDFEDIVMDIWSRYANEQELKQQMDNLGEELISAREHYRVVKELDDRLLGELLPDE